MHHLQKSQPIRSIIPPVHTAPLAFFGWHEIYWWAIQAFILHHVFNSHTFRSWHDNFHCIGLAGYLFQLSLSVPTNGVSLRVFHPVLPFFLRCVPLYATNPKPSIDSSAIRVVLSSNGDLFIFAILLWSLSISMSAYSFVPVFLRRKNRS